MMLADLIGKGGDEGMNWLVGWLVGLLSCLVDTETGVGFVVISFFLLVICAK